MEMIYSITLKEALSKTAIFQSQIWSDTVSYIRDKLDIKVDDAYITNIIDEHIRSDYGDWELYPEYVDSMSASDFTLDLAAIQRQVDAVIGTNSLYWRKMVDMLDIEWHPEYNVDAYETRTTEYGEHVTEQDVGARQKTDVNGPTSRTYNAAYGQQSSTEGQRSDSIAHGAETDQHYETTMNDLTYKAKTKDDSAAYTDQSTKGSQTNTIAAHTDNITDSTISVTNSESQAAATDTTTSNEHTDTETTRRYGNIGVTKTSELLTDAMIYYRRSRIVPIIAVEIAKSLTWAVWY